MAGAPIITWASDSAVRVELGSEISAPVRARVRAAYEALKGAPIAGLLDVVPAYTTVLLSFDLDTMGEAGAVIGEVERRLADLEERPATPGRVVEVPVCYEGECAPDLEEVARLRGMTAQEVVRLHSGAEYEVDFVGFSPGFAYLSGLPKELATARLERPRARVPAGSVAIGGEQAGVYPHATPGGWRIIGRTPLVVFDAARERPALLGMGDRVRFVAITAERFRELEG